MVADGAGAGSTGPSGRDGPHTIVADLDHPELSDDDRHHFARVVRLRPGDALTVSDGRGGWRPCRFGPELEPVGPAVLVPRPTPPIDIAFALVKGQRPELVTQKLTELGADVIRPFVAARSVVRWDATKAEAHTERLRRVAREACMQSRRCWLPEVCAPVPFAAIGALPGLTLAERTGGPLPLGGVVAIGPEGGWSAEELAAGHPTAGLGGHVLRAETAAIAAAVLLAAARDRAAGPAAAAG